jgi:hypothetical protein
LTATWYSLANAIEVANAMNARKIIFRIFILSKFLVEKDGSCNPLLLICLTDLLSEECCYFTIFTLTASFFASSTLSYLGRVITIPPSIGLRFNF